MGRTVILGIESSCDETACAIVIDGEKIIESVVASSELRHAPFGGIVPEIASRAHAEVITGVIGQTLERANMSRDDITAIAVANRPGLLGSLLVGLTAAKSLSWAWEKPLVAVHHLEAHLYASRWAEGIEFPFVGLVASGGHTSLYYCESFTKARRIGVTVDDAAGEAFDKVSALLGLGYPGGPAIEKATKGVTPKSVKFPRPKLKNRPFDFTYSGLKTAVLYHVKGIPPAPEPIIPESSYIEVAAAFQDAAVDMLVKPTIKAALEMGARAVTATGGVAANSLLRERLTLEAEKVGIKAAFTSKALCVDNAVMVAGLGYHELMENGPCDLSIDVNSRPERAPLGAKASDGKLREKKLKHSK